jgi:hypothetical protein
LFHAGSAPGLSPSEVCSSHVAGKTSRSACPSWRCPDQTDRNETVRNPRWLPTDGFGPASRSRGVGRVLAPGAPPLHKESGSRCCEHPGSGPKAHSASPLSTLVRRKRLSEVPRCASRSHEGPIYAGKHAGQPHASCHRTGEIAPHDLRGGVQTAHHRTTTLCTDTDAANGACIAPNRVADVSPDHRRVRRSVDADWKKTRHVWLRPTAAISVTGNAATLAARCAESRLPFRKHRPDEPMIQRSLGCLSDPTSPPPSGHGRKAVGPAVTSRTGGFAFRGLSHVRVRAANYPVLPE